MRAHREALALIQAELSRFLIVDDFAKTWKLIELERLIAEELRRLGVHDIQLMREYFAEMYEETFGRQWYGIEKELGVYLDMQMPNKQAVVRAIDVPISGLRLDNRMRRNVASVYRGIREALAVGLAQGHHYEKIAGAIERRLEIGRNRALLIAQTQGHMAVQRARLDSIERSFQAGVDMVKVWDATLDGRTRPAHRALDGMKVRPDENFRSPAGGYGPGPGQMGSAKDNIRCRCTVRGELIGFSPDERYSRSAEGQRGSIIPWQSYEEWANERLFY